MQGKDLIKAILDNGMVDEEIKIVGLLEDSTNKPNPSVDMTFSTNIVEVCLLEMEDGEEVCSIVVNASLVE